MTVSYEQAKDPAMRCVNCGHLPLTGSRKLSRDGSDVMAIPLYRASWSSEACPHPLT